MHKRLNLKKPRLYNEKLQWLKLHDRKDIYHIMVDKYDVRDYISRTIGDEYLIKCFGVYDSVDEIDIDALPDRFVLKCTHDSGSVEICKDKPSFDIEEAKNRLREACRRNYYSTYREWPYKGVKARIIAEEYLEDETGDLKDYKVMCFNGKAEVIEVHENRFTEGKEHTQTFYDRDWKKLEITQPGLYSTSKDFVKQELHNKMLELSETLSGGLYHLRVDWYILGNQLKFGELTFYDGSGFFPFTRIEDEEYLGNLIKLPTDK
ncbi:MAG: glycosyl transferase [Lachnospiraceae bacterium]|nr:glycosyl transferase [Lachnospiraceae bacterium]